MGRTESTGLGSAAKQAIAASQPSPPQAIMETTRAVVEVIASNLLLFGLVLIKWFIRLKNARALGPGFSNGV
jgi:hypothetical protein